MEELFATACLAIDQEADALEQLSLTIWRNPELLFQERIAHDVLTNFLEERGFAVERGYKNVETAFRATWECQATGESEHKAPNIAVLCEYDALPEIGHACGHNQIAQLGVAAALGVKAVMEKHGRPVGKLTVLGTPAEEGGGGKIVLMEAGAFDDVHVAMMCHPCSENIALPETLAMQQYTITYHGKACHASASPWDGINALDAAIQAYNSISALRQQLKPTTRVHGIFTKGGTKANIIPDLTQLEYCIRAKDRRELEVVAQKVTKCWEGAAIATGCTVDIDHSQIGYSDINNNRTLAKIYEKHINMVEPDRRNFTETVPLSHLMINYLVLSGDNFHRAGTCPVGSTDMGNVSYVCPSIHPMYRIGAALNHSKEFTKESGTRPAFLLSQNQGKALALTAIEIMSDLGLLGEITAEFREKTGQK
ncbi:peptidase M20 domain-containing protein 2-like [Physella acuta]|uniref:peptidase M20 domain-containing protein 2-like n=1 Tax=Physella acuta TaxID=109671 RepID=UPI0027DB964D|nr:peptidase M20 domain-containing protein 2-like [Physella acuta]